MQSYHRVLEILSIIQTIPPISYNEDVTFEVHKLCMESYVGRMDEPSKALALRHQSLRWREFESRSCQ